MYVIETSEEALSAKEKWRLYTTLTKIEAAFELFGDTGYLIFDPDWKPVRWSEDEVEKPIIFNGAPLRVPTFSTASTGKSTSKI